MQLIKAIGSVPVWTEPRVDFETTTKVPETVDVCVIGAGIAGLTTAYLCAREGKKVAVLERNAPVSGETFRTTAHLSNAIDARYLEIERLHGEKGARLAADSHTAAIARIEQICRDENIQCGFERLPGYLWAARDSDKSSLQEEAAAANRAGVAATFSAEVSLSPKFKAAALIFPEQAQFHPLLYLEGLARALVRRGGKIVSGVVVTGVQGGTPHVVSGEAETILHAEAVVVATNSPVNDRIILHSKQAAYRTYAQAYEVATESVPPALFWDTLDPYHYVRRQTIGEKTFLIVGGEDHRVGQAEDERSRHGDLAAWAKRHFPVDGPPTYRWSGQVEETIDGLAFIGQNPTDAPGIFVATGDCGMGMTHGTIAGILLTDLILKRKNPWAELYDPGRKTKGALKEWAKENLNTVAQYRDLITPAEVSAEEEIKVGEGAILRAGLKKVAAYRNESGTLCRLSAYCPHLGGVVRWNSAEKSWDCPCHGSRFSATGEVLNGPSTKGLAVT